MKLWISCLLVVALVSTLAPNESDAWFIRFRRIGRAIRRVARTIGDTVKTVGCGLACAKECNGLVCRGTCALCQGRRKRSLDGAGNEGLVPDTGFTLIPLPRDFKAYDQEPRDGFIDYIEFVAGAGVVMAMDDDETREMFNRADKDKDDRISREEFRKAPWMFEDEDDVGDIEEDEYEEK